MFLETWFASIKNRAWRHFLPMFEPDKSATPKTYNYYSVGFSDVNNEKYQLASVRNNSLILSKWVSWKKDFAEKINMPLNELENMNVEIIHWRKQGPLRFNSILLFTLNYYTRLVYVKNIITRGKNSLLSMFASSREMTGLDRIVLLRLMLKEYVQESPQKTHVGVTADEVVELLYGALWYNHIRNEAFRRKIELLLQSLIITGDIVVDADKYYVQGQAVSTIVSWEAQERREHQQFKIERNMHRLMLVITASTVMITLAILAQAGVVDLHRIWTAITQIKPLQFLLKLI